MASEVAAILAERNVTHGSFRDNARISQGIKSLYETSPNWPSLDAVTREALDMIAGKISRCLSGNPKERDHFHDIAGYATLVVEEIEIAANPVFLVDPAKLPLAEALAAPKPRAIEFVPEPVKAPFPVVEDAPVPTAEPEAPAAPSPLSGGPVL